MVEAASVTKQPVAQLKPRSIVVLPTSRARIWSIRRSASSATRPGRRRGRSISSSSSLYPGYSEPNVDDHRRRHQAAAIASGCICMWRRRVSCISRPPALAQARAVRDTCRSPSGSIPPSSTSWRPPPTRPARSEARVIHNQHPQRKWCEGRDGGDLHPLDLQARRPAAGRHPARQQARGRARGAFPTRSNSTASSPCCRRPRSTELGLAKLTQLDTPPAGALEQSIFYINQVMQFGKLLAVFQAHPSDPGKTVVSVFTALAIESNVLGKQKQFANVPVLRNLVPAQVLVGQELVQQRQIAERRAAGLCPQPDPRDRGDPGGGRPGRRQADASIRCADRACAGVPKRRISRFSGPYLP